MHRDLAQKKLKLYQYVLFHNLSLNLWYKFTSMNSSPTGFISVNSFWVYVIETPFFWQLSICKVGKIYMGVKPDFPAFIWNEFFSIFSQNITLKSWIIKILRMEKRIEQFGGDGTSTSEPTNKKNWSLGCKLSCATYFSLLFHNMICEYFVQKYLLLLNRNFCAILSLSKSTS